jgi:leucyl-tRNA synthetase
LAPVVAGAGASVAPRAARRGGALSAAERAIRRKTHDTIRRVTADIEQRQQLNTAVSAMMELVNELYAFSEASVTGSPSRRGDGARPQPEPPSERSAPRRCS